MNQGPRQSCSFLMSLFGFPVCPLCDVALETGFGVDGDLCRTCWAQVFRGEPDAPAGLCALCGHTLLGEVDLCADCCRQPWSFARLDGLVPYRSPAGELLRAYKGRNRSGLARCWSRLSVPRLAPAAPLVPVPCHPQHFLERGWDPVARWAHFLSRDAQVPVWNLLIRRRTVSQKLLGRAERSENATRSYCLRRDAPNKLKGQKLVWLLDDVVTTGSTVEACAKELLRGGVAEVRVLALCLH